MIDRNPSELPSTLLDKNVPRFETESLLKEEKFISSEVFGKEITLVNFFATWCKPCRDEKTIINNSFYIFFINFISFLLSFND